MGHHLSITPWIPIVAVVVTTGAHDAAQGDVERDALQRFQQSTNEYMALRHEIERHLPPLEMSENARSIQQAVEARAAAIRLARANASVGDIFTADVREAFRSRILQALESRGYVASDLLGDVNEGGEEREPPVVNGRFSWRTATPTPACVLAALPELPQELQYRFLGRDLLLVDIDANLIIDILPDAVEITPAGLRGILARRAHSFADRSERVRA